MHLKKLELQGFKSFPDKTILDFGQGLTMIVGPNGSGKSNISDAIRWVLGEQSVKHLRGSKMEDVIFAGTQDRKALGFAEVSITIDNQDRRMEIDFSEITVTRRVFRSGESEYFINGAACRLKDIHEVFMDTGLGRDGYSIIGQGKIDEILSNKAEDRRQIFEEAAGISKYKYRKLEAERKLTGTEENLTRLYDILFELEERLGPLEQQAETAKKYLALREQLKQLEVSLSVENIDKFRKLLSEIDQSIDGVNEQIRLAKEEMDGLEREINGMHRENEENNEKISLLREEITAIEGRKHQYSDEIALFRETISTNEQTVLRLGEEQQRFAASVSEGKTQKEAKQEQLSAAAKEKESISAQIAELTVRADAVAETVRRAEELLKEKNEDLVGVTAELGELKAALSHVDTLEETYGLRQQELADTLREQEEQKAALASEGEEIRSRAAAVIGDRDELGSLLEELEQHRRAQTEALEEQNALLRKTTAELQAKSDRRKMLEEMEREFEGFQKGAKEILQKKDSLFRSVRIHGSLSQLITVEPRFVTAVEIALGQALQNIVTETEEDAKRCIAFLKENRLGRVTFLPVSSVKPRDFTTDPSDEKGYLGIASELVSADPKYEGILSSLLGATVVVDTLDHAIRMAKHYHYKFRIVTLEGELCNVGGSMTGGYVNRRAGILSRANDCRLLERETKKLSEQAEELRQEIDLEETELKELTDRIGVLTEEQQENNNRLILLAAEQKHSDEALAAIGAQIEKTVAERDRISERITQIREETVRKRARLDEISGGSEVLAQDAERAKQAYEAAVAERETLANTVTDCRMKLLEQENAEALFLEQLRSLENRMEFDDRERALRIKQEQELRRKNELLAGQIEEKIARITSSDSEIAEKRESITALEQSRQGDKEAIAQKQEQTKETMDRIMLLQQEVGRIESKKAKAEVEIDTVVNRLWEDYGLTYHTALEIRTEIPSITRAQKEIAALKREIASLGHINIDAIEEFKQVRDRVTFLSSQRDDLLEAKQSLEKIIRDMQALMKEIFTKQFAVINDYFRETFRQLFGGGDARLYLSDPDEVLESGIEIEVQPPGKKLQNMMLLSGGEKALCAIAILFAIIQTRPAPFCIFDEIEAALDDSNVFRFANYLRAFNDRTQFIVVTHRRGTMEAADRLYGITMEKKGISRMICLDIDELDQFNAKK